MIMIKNMFCIFASNFQFPPFKMADRPKSTLSTLSHVTERTAVTQVSARGTPMTPAHKTWSAYTGPILFTGQSVL